MHKQQPVAFAGGRQLHQERTSARLIATSVCCRRFLLAEDLPLGYREQVVEFILRNTQGAAAPVPANVDPFTGSGAYMPGAGGGSSSGGWGASAGGSADPFTGV